MKILCHVGPWCVEQYRSIAYGVNQQAEITMISGFKTADETGLVTKYYRYINEFNKKSLDVEVIYQDYLDIILRCRLLRALKKQESVIHLLAMKKALVEVLDSQQPELIISETIDQFLIDLIFIEAKKRDIPFFGLVITFVNGYYRFSAKGEFNIVREVPEDEVAHVLSELEKKSYKPVFVDRSRTKKIVYPITQWAKNIIRIPYFTAKRFLLGEMYNYHYWASLKTSIDNFNLLPNYGFSHKDWSERLEASSVKKIFIPLQYYPEATIEYWCDSLSVIDYEKVLFEVVSKLSSDFHIVLKEHPNVVGLRPSHFYQRFARLENVTFCPADESSNELIEKTDAVLVWTGTVGFEAALRGKPVLCLCEAYYVYGKAFRLIKKNTSSIEIKEFISSYEGLGMQDKKEMVSHLLSGFLPGRYKNDWSWQISLNQDREESNQTGVFIGEIIQNGLLVK
jgi:hypothetical protein